VKMRDRIIDPRALAGPGLLLLLCAAALLGQDAAQVQRHESVVVNIEVPVRVLKKDAFVDGLTLADFEVFENGVRQDLEAVYLIRGRRVLRHYVLYLDLKEYLPKVGQALDYFFEKVLGPGDSLYVVTPAKTYRFRSEALERVPRRQISDRLKGKLKTDIQIGNSAYRNLMKDFYHLEEEEFPAELMDVKERMLFDLAVQMRDLNQLTEDRVMAFAETLKALEGDKHVFLIFQRDVLPDHAFSDDLQAELFKSVSFDVDRIKRHFADASLTVHCLYITKTPEFALNPLNVGRPGAAFRMQDLSADIYASFKEIAVATGGLTESTTNPDFALRQAADASSNYYLLYYRPVDYRADGKFHEIKVKVRGEGLKVTHRLGYIAD
jgi:autonomous glycyl radical cofactor GrcA